MSHFFLHRGPYWFRIRVPARHALRYGSVVCINLQTSEREIARSLALRLAAEWLSRFCGDGGMLPAADAQPPVATVEKAPPAALPAAARRSGGSLGAANCDELFP